MSKLVELEYHEENRHYKKVEQKKTRGSQEPVSFTWL